MIYSCLLTIPCGSIHLSFGLRNTTMFFCENPHLWSIPDALMLFLRHFSRFFHLFIHQNSPFLVRHVQPKKHRGRLPWAPRAISGPYRAARLHRPVPPRWSSAWKAMAPAAAAPLRQAPPVGSRPGAAGGKAMRNLFSQRRPANRRNLGQNGESSWSELSSPSGFGLKTGNPKRAKHQGSSMAKTDGQCEALPACSFRWGNQLPKCSHLPPRSCKP